MSTLRRLSSAGLPNICVFVSNANRWNERWIFSRDLCNIVRKNNWQFLMCSMSENRLNNTTNTTNHYNNAFITTDIGNTHFFIVCQWVLVKNTGQSRDEKEKERFVIYQLFIFFDIIVNVFLLMLWTHYWIHLSVHIVFFLAEENEWQEAVRIMYNLFKRQWNVTYICIHKRHFHPQCSQQFIIWPICCHGVYGEVGNIDK